MALSWQPSLLDSGPACFDAGPPSAHRLDLGSGAWVDHVPGWAHGADALFASVLDQAPWASHERPMYDRMVVEPRLTTHEWDRPPPAIPAMAEALSAHYGCPLGVVSANLYRDGRDSVAWHGDRVGRARDETVVAILSLGSPRRFLLRPAAGGQSLRFVTPGGRPAGAGRHLPADVPAQRPQVPRGRAPHQRDVPRGLLTAPHRSAGPAVREAGRVDRLAAALAAIDAANADDPNTIVVGGVERPKEQAHAEMMTAWVERLDPSCSEEQVLAARAHHLRRWTLPRSDFPEGRAGYLRWRTALKKQHADEVAAILRHAGYDGASIERVQQIVRKQGLGHDPAVQAHEDALCLVFLETQFDELADQLGEDKTVDVLRKTAAKMSPEGLAAAQGLPFSPAGAALLARALGAD